MPMNPLWIVVIIILVVFALGGLPQWGYHSYGAFPSSIGFILVIVLLILLLTGRL
jgi:hypothetical protein